MLRGDLFDPLPADEQFDLIVSNPPYVPSRTRVLPRHTVARCWDGGPDGRLLVERICAGSLARLRPGGALLLVQSTVTDEGRTLDTLRRGGFDVEVVRRQSVPFGPVMRSRVGTLRRLGLIRDDQHEEELVVVMATRPWDTAEGAPA